ncbi:aspartic peptidase domain-containing protein [Astrocystis sublimbata]|nr:aspartic peptidase domain-containing protein [Astrocystis sublimbata]
MPSLSNILFLVYGLIALAAASPTNNIQKRGVYKVERVPKPNSAPRNGPRALLKTLRKYRMPVPDSLVDAAVKQEEMISKRGITKRAPRRQKGMGNGVPLGGFSVSSFGGKGKGGRLGASAAGGGKAPQQDAVANTNGTGLVVNVPEDNDVEYLSPVNIGGQIVNLDFDTGSSDLWVFNTQLSSAATTGHSLYDPQSSATFKLIDNAQFQISYGDGSGAEGNVGTDVVNIGGAEVKAQAVELATGVTQSFVDDMNTDGLLGLAFSSINTVQPQQQKTFFDNVMKDLAQPLFTADLRAGANGAYEFGRIDTSKFTGEMKFVDVNNTQGFWQFTSDKFAVDGGKAQASVAGNQAIADTGTTLMLADPAIAEGYYKQVDGAQNNAQAGGFVFPCDSKLPDLQVAVGGEMATVKGKDLNFAPADQAGTVCFGGLQAGQSGGLQVYGDILFKSNFVVFDGGKNQLGFAEHV